MSKPRSGPLAHIRAIEFCQVLSGPYCGMLLADMGVDVIKVEPPVGDSMRAWPPITQGYSENFAAINRNKRAISLDLKKPEDLEIAKRLIQSADVVLENNRPGVMDRLGLGYKAMSATNPKLIYCSISAFGQTGPRSQNGGFDVTVQASSGVMSVTGEEGSAPVKAGVPISDVASGLYGAYAIFAQIIEVMRTGRGGHLDVSLQSANLGIAALQTSEYFGTGKNPKPLGSAHPRNAPYQAFKAKDGYFVLAAGNDKLWTSVNEVTGTPELVKDPRFLKTSDRARNQVELKGILEKIFASKTPAEWIPLFLAKGVPCEAILSYSDVLADEHTAHMKWVQQITLPGGTVTKTVGPVVLVDGKTADIYRDPPALDGDRADILSELDRIGDKRVK